MEDILRKRDEGKERLPDYRPIAPENNSVSHILEFPPTGRVWEEIT